MLGADTGKGWLCSGRLHCLSPGRRGSTWANIASRRQRKVRSVFLRHDRPWALRSGAGTPLRLRYAHRPPYSRLRVSGFAQTIHLVDRHERSSISPERGRVGSRLPEATSFPRWVQRSGLPTKGSYNCNPRSLGLWTGRGLNELTNVSEGEIGEQDEKIRVRAVKGPRKDGSKLRGETIDVGRLIARGFRPSGHATSPSSRSRGLNGPKLVRVRAGQNRRCATDGGILTGLPRGWSTLTGFSALFLGAGHHPTETGGQRRSFQVTKQYERRWPDPPDYVLQRPVADARTPLLALLLLAPRYTKTSLLSR